VAGPRRFRRRPLGPTTPSPMRSRAATACGFERLPRGFESIATNHIKSVSDYDDAWRLRPLVVGTLLAAKQQDNHPMHRAARSTPNLLELIASVTAAAGAAVHSVGGGALDIAQVRMQVNDTIQIGLFHCLLPQRALDSHIVHLSML